MEVLDTMNPWVLIIKGMVIGAGLFFFCNLRASRDMFWKTVPISFIIGFTLEMVLSRSFTRSLFIGIGTTVISLVALAVAYLIQTHSISIE